MAESQQEPQEGAQASQPAEVAKDERTMAMLAHLLAIFTGFLGPLIIWLVKKEDSAFVDDQGKEALNFQLTILIAWFAAGLLTFVLVGCILLPAIWVLDLVFCIMGATKASKGIRYRYPLNIRFIK